MQFVIFVDLGINLVGLNLHLPPQFVQNFKSVVINWLAFCIRIYVVLTIASAKNSGIIPLIAARHCMGDSVDVSDDNKRVIMADEDEIILVDLDDDELDPRLTSGNLSVTFEDESVILLSQQTPTRELWLSANYTAWHFLRTGGSWVERDTGEPLLNVLSKLFSEKLGETVTFSS